MSISIYLLSISLLPVTKTPILSTSPIITSPSLQSTLLPTSFHFPSVHLHTVSPPLTSAVPSTFTSHQHPLTFHHLLVLFSTFSHPHPCLYILPSHCITSCFLSSFTSHQHNSALPFPSLPSDGLSPPRLLPISTFQSSSSLNPDCHLILPSLKRDIS